MQNAECGTGDTERPAFRIRHFAFCINIILTPLTPFLEHTVTTHSDLQALPLTRLSEDERLFRHSVY